MQKLPLIKFLTVAVAALMLGVTVQAQTNATYLNLRSMPTTTPGSLDYAIFGHASGTNLFWYRDYWSDIYANFTNTPAGQAMLAASATNAANIAANGAANLVTSNGLAAETAARIVTSNALASAVSAASAQATTVSNSVNFKLAGYYGTNNAAGYQTAAQVSATAAAAAAAAAAGIVSSNGAAAFGSVISSNALYNVFDNGQATAKTVNLGTASMQTVEFTNVSGNSVLSLTGYAAGQNVTIVCFNNTGSALTMTLPVGIKNLVASAATLANIPTAGVVVFNILSTTTGAAGAAMSYSRSY